MRLQYGADFSFVCILLHVQCSVYAQLIQRTENRMHLKQLYCGT